MRPLAIRPKKIRVEFEELEGGMARVRYEEELENEELAKHTLKLLGKKMEGAKFGLDGSKLWIEAQGERKKEARALASEFFFLAVGDERDALDLIYDISSQALIGTFSVSEAEAKKIAKEPLSLETFPEEVLEKSVGELIEQSKGAENFFIGHVALDSLRLAIKEGIIKEDEKIREALPKMDKFRKKVLESG